MSLGLFDLESNNARTFFWGNTDWLSLSYK